MGVNPMSLRINRRLVDFKHLVRRLMFIKQYNQVAAFGVETDNPSQNLLIRLEHFLKQCLLEPTIK